MTTGSLILQLSYLLLVFAVAMSRRLVRLFIALSAAVGLAHAIWWSGDPATIVWMSILLAVCLIALGRELLAARQARFTAEEEAMLSGFLSGVPRHVARHLIDRGTWLHGTDSDMLTCEGEPVERLLYLASGEAKVFSESRHVATCRPGDLIGEASVLSGEAATATVVLATPARFWCIPAAALRAYLAADPELGTILERSFASAVRVKLHASNRTIAAAGGVG